MYNFKRGKADKNVQMSGWNVAELLGLEDSQEHQASYLGKVKTLFGEPDSTSSDMEDLFSYDIVAEDSDGNVIPLEIYFGPSGPAIASPGSIGMFDNKPPNAIGTRSNGSNCFLIPSHSKNKQIKIIIH